MLGAFALAGCTHEMTLAEAQAACTKQGGLLMVVHEQKVTLAGVGPEVAKPGDCVSPTRFDKPGQATSAAPAPTPNIVPTRPPATAK